MNREAIIKRSIDLSLHSPITHRLLLLVAVLVAYSNSFRCAFQFDDRSNIKLALSSQASGLTFYLWNSRAIGHASLALDHWVYGQNVVGYHVTNLLVHLGATLLLYGLTRLLFYTPFMARSMALDDSEDDWRQIAGSVAFFTALLFAVHPVQTQAVTYIVQRFTSLATLFYLAAVYCYARARLAFTLAESPHSSQRFQLMVLYLLALLATFLAMRTKEIAFTLPLAIVLVEILFFDGSLKTRLALIAPFLLFLILPIIPLAVLGLQPNAPGALDRLDDATRLKTEMPRAHYLFTELRVIVTYLRLLVFPVGQNLDYDYPTYRSLFEVPVLVSFLGLLSLFIVALSAAVRSAQARSLFGRASRLVALGIFWFFLTLSIESSIFPIRDIINEHRLYLPSAGIFFAVSTAVFLGAWRFCDHRRRIHATLVAGFLVIATVFGFLTFRRNEIWATPVSLWEDVTRKSPKRSRAWNNLGTAYLERHEPLKAIPVLIRSYELNPGWADVPSNVAVALKQLGNFEGRYLTGFEFLSRDGEVSLMFFSRWLPIALNNIGLAYEILDQHAKAIEKFERAIRLAPGFAAARLNRGLAALAVGDLERARMEQDALEGLAPALASVLRGRLQEAGGVPQKPSPAPTQSR